MTSVEEVDSLGLGLSRDGANIAGRHPIIKQPSASQISSQDSTTPFSHHRSPSWVRSPPANLEPATPSFAQSQQRPSSSHRFSSVSFAAEPISSQSDMREGQVSMESNCIDQIESYESGLSPKTRNPSNTSFTSTLSHIKRVDQSIIKNSFKQSNTQSSDSLSTASSASNEDSMQNIHDTIRFSGTPARNRATLERMFVEGVSPRTRISRGSIISARSSSRSVDEIEKRRNDLTGFQETNFGTLDSFEGLPYVCETTADMYPLAERDSTIEPDSQQNTPAERLSFNPSLALLMAEEGRDIRVEANGRPLSEVEILITSRTTHLILSKCHDATMVDFLERVLPIVSRSLVVLDISYCQLKAYPQSLSQCNRLEELNLSGNDFLHSWHNDPNALVRFYSTLQVLLLDHCALTILPGMLMHFRQLRSLSARGNHLTHLPAWLYHLHQLERISVGENPFIGPWIDICLPFTTAIVYTSAASDLEYSVRLAADVSAKQDSSERRRSRSLSHGRSSHFVLPKGSNQTIGPEDVLEELEDEGQVTGDQHFVQMISSSASQYVNGSSMQNVRPMLSTKNLKALSDLEVSSVASNSSNDVVLATPSSVASSNFSLRKGSTGEADVGRWLTFRRKKVSKKASSTVLELSSESTQVIPIQKTEIATVPEQRSKSSKHRRRPKTAGATTPPERTSSLSLSSMNSSVTKGIDDDGSEIGGSSSDQNSPHKQKKAHRTSFLPFALPIDPDARTALDADIHQRRNVKILLEYLEDLSLLNPDQRKLNDLLDRPRSESISSEGSSSYLPALSRSGSESDSSTSNSTRPSSDDDSQSKIASCASPLNLQNEQSSPSAIGHPETVLSTIAIKDDAVRRANIISEIIATEQTYVKSLRELIDIYVVPSSRNDAHNQPHIPLAERRAVFGNVEAIQHFHSQAFLPSLFSAAEAVIAKNGERPDVNDEEAVESYKELTIRVAETIAQTFERHVAFFRMYTAYVNNLESGQARVASWLATTVPSVPYLRGGYSMSNLRREATSMTKNLDILASHAIGSGAKHDSEIHTLHTKDRKRIKLFLQRARLDKNHSQISLEAYLHLPVQRIPRYRLLFEDLVKCCPFERLKDSRSIINALQSINSIATMMNESKRQSEMNKRLLKWQERIRGTFPSPLVQPHRKLLHDGSLTLTRVVTRIPSFTVRKTTILADTTWNDWMDEPSLLQIADAEQMNSYVRSDGDQFRNHKAQQEQGEKDLPPSPPSKDHQYISLQVHHLEQRFVSTAVEVILCNDLLVILEASQIQSTSSSTNTPANLTLFTVMRMEGNAKLMDERTLRICDAEKIYYLTAKHRKEAEEWQRCFTIATNTPS